MGYFGRGALGNSKQDASTYYQILNVRTHMGDKAKLEKRRSSSVTVRPYAIKIKTYWDLYY
jgi:hypothetical protein